MYKNNFQDSKKVSTVSNSTNQLLVPVYEDEGSKSFVVESWYNKSMWLYLLYPFSIIFKIISSFRKNRLQSKSLSKPKPKIPIIIVGNITIGGTGKTPLVKYIAQNLQKLGYKPGLVSRGYGGKFKETLRVDESTSVKQTGDEAQILSTLGLPFYIDKNRLRAVNKIINETDCNVCLLYTSPSPRDRG